MFLLFLAIITFYLLRKANKYLKLELVLLMILPFMFLCCKALQTYEHCFVFTLICIGLLANDIPKHI